MRSIADYEIVAPLGSGSQGQVWLANPSPRLGIADQVAVKIMDRAVGEPEFQRVVKELKAHAAAKSPHLAALYDAGVQGERLYIAMEYFPLGSLAEGTVDQPEALRAVADAARGAHALHEVGLVHRNIKPANIMRHVGGAKLVGLGLSHLIAPGQTVTGVGLGSVEYMEPEVVRGERATRRTDIWSLGVTLHRVLTGRSIYGDLPTGSLVSQLMHISTSPPQIDATLPGDWLAIVNRCLAPDRKERFPTALAVAEEIERVEGLVTT
jgi:eukaryotic-like serine/threonine-protein kinase